MRTERRSRTRPGTWSCSCQTDCTAGRRHTCHAPLSFLTLFLQPLGNENPGEKKCNVQFKTKSKCYHGITRAAKWRVRLLRTVRHSKFLLTISVDASPLFSSCFRVCLSSLVFFFFSLLGCQWRCSRESCGPQCELRSYTLQQLELEF